MFFDLSKPQRLLKQSVRDFARREFSSEKVRDLMETEAGVDPDLWSEIADQGWIGLHLPEQVDGLGLGAVDLAVVAEELGYACAPGPWLFVNWAATLLCACGDTDIVPKLAEGISTATVASHEFETGWSQKHDYLATSFDSAQMQLNGQKRLVCNAEHAKWLVVTALEADEFVIVLVPRETEGLSITVSPGMDQTRRYYECVFDNVRVSQTQVLARGAKAEEAWEKAALVTTVAASAEMVGLMQWMLEATVEYSNTRKQFDKPIGSFQAVQAKCADMLMHTESARSATWYAAWALQEDDADHAKAVSIAKAYVSDAVHKVGNMAIQAHGGIGFTWEHDLQLYYKRARADEYLLGDATEHRERIASSIFSG